MPRRKTRILLVDGDSTVQHLRALMLRMQGYDVDTAADLDAARTVIAAAAHTITWSSLMLGTLPIPAWNSAKRSSGGIHIKKC